jgi:hypothetical protein
MSLGRQPTKAHLTVLAAALLPMTAAVNAATMTEYFDYGDIPVANMLGPAPSLGLNGGSGWGGAWQVPTTPSSTANVSYAPNSTIVFNNAYYSGAGNLSGATHGVAMSSTTDNVSYRAARSFPTALTGTIWISMLVRHGSNTTGDALIWLYTPGAATEAAVNTFIGLRSGDQPNLRYIGATTTASELTSANTSLLYLARISIDASGSNDALDFWVKKETDDISSVEALGVPLLSKSTGNPFGAGLEKMAFSGVGGSADTIYDSLRVSNDANAFDVVRVGVPEPATFGALCVGGMAVAMRRRRRVCGSK